jgi:multicomponent Na+:H+ antiporter subunit G
MIDVTIMVLSSIGALFILFAAIGFVRMPDFFLTTVSYYKSGYIRSWTCTGSSSSYFEELSIVTRILAIIFFLFITAPVAAHMISRTAYFIGTKLWDKTDIDDMEGMYNKQSHKLSSEEEEEEEPKAGT